MRMRQLGRGHSISFFASTEVHLSIQQFINNPTIQISSQQVLEWAINNTIQIYEQSMVQWASQGFEFIKRDSGRQFIYQNNLIESNCEIYNKCSKIADPVKLIKLYGKGLSKKVASMLIQIRKNAISLEISNNFENNSFKYANIIGEEIDKRTSIYLKDYRVHFQNLEDEQERELEQEIEEEIQIFRPPNLEPCKPQKHPLLENLISGKIPQQLNNNWPLFLNPLSNAFKDTKLCDFENEVWDNRLKVTPDFIQTVKKQLNTDNLDYYLRPATHSLIVWNNQIPQYLILLSPFEMNIVLEHYHKKTLHSSLTIHHLSPMNLINKSNKLLYSNLHETNNNRIPSISDLLFVQLNIFAGSTFYGDSVDKLISIIGVIPSPGTKYGISPTSWKYLIDSKVILETGYLIEQDCNISNIKDSKDVKKIEEAKKRIFKKSPVQFLKDLIEFRYQNDQLPKSDLGEILQIEHQSN